MRISYFSGRNVYIAEEAIELVGLKYYVVCKRAILQVRLSGTHARP